MKIAVYSEDWEALGALDMPMSLGSRLSCGEAIQFAVPVSFRITRPRKTVGLGVPIEVVMLCGRTVFVGHSRSIAVAVVSNDDRDKLRPLFEGRA